MRDALGVLKDVCHFLEQNTVLTLDLSETFYNNRMLGMLQTRRQCALMKQFKCVIFLTITDLKIRWKVVLTLEQLLLFRFRLQMWMCLRRFSALHSRLHISELLQMDLVVLLLPFG